MFQVINAEFGIEKKRILDGAIAELLVRRLEADNSMSYVGWYSRQVIVDHIKQGHTYMTIIISGNWCKGADINVVRTNFGEYLRTDRNRTSADNLDNIPEG